jgi:Ca-activated chloride channel family protein
MEKTWMCGDLRLVDLDEERGAAMVGTICRGAAVLGLVTWTAAGPGGTGSPTAQPALTAPSVEDHVTQGALRVKQKDGAIVECPLKHTDVKAEVSGFIARVKVTQTFSNPFDEPIEAVYVFPLPHQAAVDEMTMVIGTRRIVGTIQRRTQARQIYEAALAAGLTAALLEQERPNIFTQSVANIQPKQDVNIEISYVDVLKYDMGVYSFHFPMVVGPRYIPGAPISGTAPLPPELQGKVGEPSAEKGVRNRLPVGPSGADAQTVPDTLFRGEPSGTGWAPDTTRVPDASRITPPVLKPGFRTGHDISLSLSLEAGVAIQDLKVKNHEAEVKRDGASRAKIVLSREDAIPNKDFQVDYAVVGAKPEMALLCHAPKAAAGRGYFMLMVQPKEDEKLKNAPPRELYFLVDVSGSMSGQPIAKCREAMRVFFRLSKQDDRMQVITFASNSRALWETPQPVDDKSIEAGLAFVDQMEGRGGTEMLKGVKMTLEAPPDPKRVRIVVMLTDGFIGNEAEIIKEVGRKAGDRIRFWTIGIGSSPNRFLLDGVAKQGGGMSKVLGLNDKPDDLVQEIVMRIHRAQLADVKIDWGKLAIEETYPVKAPELWAGRPIILFGRYEAGGAETVRISGNVEGEHVAWPLQVNLLKEEPEHDVLAKVWARNKIESLMDQSFYQDPPEVVEEVTRVALEYQLMSQYTSFVAVDETSAPVVPPAAPPRRMVVPVPLPEGVEYEGIFGPMGDKWSEDMMLYGAADASAPAAASAVLPTSTTGQPAPSPAIVPAGPGYGYGVSGPGRPRQGQPLRQRQFAGRGGVAAAGKAMSARRAGEVAFARMIMDAERVPTIPYPEAWSQRSTERRLSSVLFDEKQMADGSRRAVEFSIAQAFAAGTDVAKRQEAAKKALDEAEALKKQGNLRAAYLKFQAVYLLDTQGDATDTAERAIADLAKTIEADEVKRAPELGKTLDLVIRNRSLQEALSDIAAAAGVKIAIASGCLDDARTLLDRRDLRVHWLDLRRATVAQAVSWVLNSFYLTWYYERRTPGIVVTTWRRMAGEPAWTYDAALLAVPLADELGKDNAKFAEVSQKAADEFLAAVRLVAPGALWIGPGRLLVVGPAKMHQDVADLLAALGTEDEQALARIARVVGEKDSEKVKALRTTAMKRLADRKDALAKSHVARDRAETLGALVEYSWKLLAEAAAGKSEDETLTELGIVWSGSRVAECAKAPEVAPMVLRSLWIVSEAAAANPKDERLNAMAKRAFEVGHPSCALPAAQLEKAPNDVSVLLSALYATGAVQKGLHLGFLSRKQSGDYQSLLGKALEAAKENPLRPVWVALRRDDAGGAATAKDLAALIEKGVGGPDAVLLTALAARRAGGETWETFRASAKDLLGRQPLPGALVVSVNRLPTANLPSAERG